MYLTKLMGGYRNSGGSYIQWRDTLSLYHKLLLAFGFALLTGIAAQVRIPLPFTPVPVTLQVFMVLLSGTILGSFFGGASMLIYIISGTAGVPWFNGFAGGYGVISGITGGYIIGFIPAVMITGWLTDKYKNFGKVNAQLMLMSLGVFIIYAFGALHFSFVTRSGFTRTFTMAVLPFIPVDLIKATIAAGISASFLRKEGF
ncbi:biotin transporter BioY [Candidatus Poribacteria bacterium]|nr:biotin transporter BioY [Candidatus Poribacteria bacterium]